jgi:membrane protein YdbS with pleckstrin-like domain
MYTYARNFPVLYSPYAKGLLLAFIPLIIAAIIWTIAIKGYALWHAARNNQKWWFIALLIVNDLGILGIIYLVWFRPSLPSRSDTPAQPSSAQA